MNLLYDTSYAVLDAWEQILIHEIRTPGDHTELSKLFTDKFGGQMDDLFMADDSFDSDSVDIQSYTYSDISESRF